VRARFRTFGTVYSIERYERVTTIRVPRPRDVIVFVCYYNLSQLFIISYLSLRDATRALLTSLTHLFERSHSRVYFPYIRVYTYIYICITRKTRNYPFNCLVDRYTPRGPDRVHIWIVSSRQMAVEWWSVSFRFTQRGLFVYAAVFETGVYHDVAIQ